MPVKTINPTPEEYDNQKKELSEKKASLGNDLLASLQLPTEENNEPKVKKQEKKDEPKEEEPKEEEEVKEAESEETEESETEDEEEELIPKSTMLKRLEREKLARVKLEAELDELKESKASSNDPRKAKLEAMSEKDLRALRRQAMREFKATDDPEKEEQLLDLQDEIDDVVRKAPERFQKAQLSEYNKAAKRAIQDNEDIDFQKDGAEIQKIAIGIYQKEKDLQKLKRGQAIALELAIDHWTEISKYSKGKDKEASLKQQVTKLKRKTSLGSGSAQGDVQKANLRKKYEKAKNSHDYDDKQAIFDHLVGDNVDKLLEN